MPKKRNRYKPTLDERKQVRAMAGFGFTIEEISVALGRGVPTLERFFKRELKDGPTIANAKVIEVLYKIATATDAKGNPVGSSSQVAAASLWVKVRANWATTEVVKIPGLPPTPPELSGLSTLTRDDLRQLERIARQLEAAELEQSGPNRIAGGSDGFSSTN